MKELSVRIGSSTLWGVLALVVALPAFAQQSGHAAVIWQDRGDAGTLDLVGGAGGADGQPGTIFTFVGESLGGTSPKFDVTDENGAAWRVKLGEEARSEAAATRLLWAAGYAVDEDYYRPHIRVLGLPRLTRGREFVSDGNVVAGARLERERGDTVTTHWSWYDNPFIGTREFNGLRVMMALVNNWDLKAVNNRAPAASDGEGQYGITDLGATFGRTGNTLSRSKAVPQEYTETQFIEKVTPTHVDFSMQSRPFFLFVFHLPNYRFRTRMESVVKHVPIADARWIGDRLGRLSAEQIRDCFRASGFSSADVDAYARVVTARIAALKALGPPSSLSIEVGAATAPPAL